MSEVLRPCLDCGELTEHATRCGDCRRAHNREAEAARYAKHGRRQRREGHESAAWRRLSKRARKMQNFCNLCGRREDELEHYETLSLDHLCSAWDKYYNNKPILLTDVQVLCSTCNNKLGSSRPGSERWNEWLENENPKERESDDSGTTSTQE